MVEPPNSEESVTVNVRNDADTAFVVFFSTVDVSNGDVETSSLFTACDVFSLFCSVTGKATFVVVELVVKVDGGDALRIGRVVPVLLFLVVDRTNSAHRSLHFDGNLRRCILISGSHFSA